MWADSACLISPRCSLYSIPGLHCVPGKCPMLSPCALSSPVWMPLPSMAGSLGLNVIVIKRPLWTFLKYQLAHSPMNCAPVPTLIFFTAFISLRIFYCLLLYGYECKFHQNVCSVGIETFPVCPSQYPQVKVLKKHLWNECMNVRCDAKWFLYNFSI